MLHVATRATGVGATNRGMTVPNERHAAAPRAFLRAGLTFIVAAGIAAAVILGVPPVLAPLLAPMGDIAVEAGVGGVLFGVLIIAGLIGQRVQRVGTPWRGTAPAPVAAAIGFAVGLGGLLLAVGLAALAGVLVPPSGPAALGLWVLAGLVVIAVQVLGEEMLMRGWLLPALGRDLGMAAAVALTALLFAGLHLLGGTRAPVTMLNLLLGGVLFGLLAWRSGGLLAPFLAHFAWNAGEVLLLGLDPNPGVSVYGAVFNFDLAGAALWGGSEEGLNASVAMSCALLALILPIAAWRAGPVTAAAQRGPVPAPIAPPNRHAWLLGEEA